MNDFVEPDLDTPAAGNSGASRYANPLAVAWRRKGLLLLGVAVCLAAGVLIYSQRTPVYQSTTQVLVVKKRSEALPTTPQGVQQVYIEDYLATHTILIRSQELLRRAARLLELTAPDAVPPGVDAVAFISTGLTVTRETRENNSGPSNVLNLAFKGGRAEDCPKILNAIIEAYRDFLNETYGDLNKEFVQQMTRAQEMLQKDIAAKQDAYDKIVAEDPLASKAKDGLGALQERVSRLEGKRADLLLRQKEIESRRELITKSLKQGTSRALLARLLENAGSPARAAAEARTTEETLATLQLQEEELRHEYGLDHPQLQALRKRIEFIRDRSARQPADVKGDPLDLVQQTLERELQENETLLKALTALLEEERGKATDMARFLVKLDTARKQMEPLQQLYDGILARMNQIRLAGDGPGYTARVIVDAGPGLKVAPSLIQTLLFAGVLGLIVGLGLAYGAELTDRSFHNPDEIRRGLGLRVIAHVPHLEPATGANTRLDPRLVAFHRPQSMAAEAFRGLRTALYFSTQGRGHQVIQVTSPHMGDGKSTIAANLAISMAQSGKRVVLIDADFRRPKVHRHFDIVDPQVGLASVILGEVPLVQAVRPSGVPGLTVLPCGPRPGNPAELLTSPRLQEVLTELRSDYDFVLIDTPPLLVVSDPAVVAPRADGVVLALRMTKNSRPSAERARELLQGLGAKVLGVVVNGLDAANLPYGYGYDYGYPYQEGYETTEADEPRHPPVVGANGRAGTTVH